MKTKQRVSTFVKLTCQQAVFWSGLCFAILGLTGMQVNANPALNSKGHNRHNWLIGIPAKGQPIWQPTLFNTRGENIFKQIKYTLESDAGLYVPLLMLYGETPSVVAAATQTLELRKLFSLQQQLKKLSSQMSILVTALSKAGLVHGVIQVPPTSQPVGFAAIHDIAVGFHWYSSPPTPVTTGTPRTPAGTNGSTSVSRLSPSEMPSLLAQIAN